MTTITHFEDLSNDLFLEIFDYFHALNLFTAFSSLNHRISSVISLTQLHIVITKYHCRQQIKFLSSHLTHHTHQVISISLEDQLRDFPSVICFIFNQHTFKNLRSCQFYFIHPSSKYFNVLEKLKRLNKLTSFRICQSHVVPLSDTTKQDFSKAILTHKSPALRSIDLLFRYNYPKLVANIAMNSTVTSLHIIFHSSTVPCSIYSLLPILRHYRALRILRTSILNDSNSNTPSPTLPATYRNNPPVSSSIKTFDLNIRTLCHFRSLNFILHCLPNLHRFIVTIIYSSSISSRWRNMFDGYQWEQLLINNTSHLEVFDLFLSVSGSNMVLNVDIVLKSFDYFARKYNDWYVGINRSQKRFNSREQQINLRGYRATKEARYYKFEQVQILLGEHIVPSTTIENPQHHLFYSNVTNLHIIIPINQNVFDTLPSTSLFQNLDSLTIEMDSSMLSFWEDMLDLFNIRCNIPEIDQNERVRKLTRLIDLTNITKLEIQPKNDISQLHFINEILLASPHVIELKIGNPLIFSPILYDNSSLIPVFNQLQSLYLLSEHIYFPIRYAGKLVERFPSLIHLELEIYSVDACIPLLNILLDGLSELIHLKIHFSKNKSFGDGTCLINQVIKRRRQAFPENICDREEVCVKIDGEILDIYLSGCSICASEKYWF